MKQAAVARPTLGGEEINVKRFKARAWTAGLCALACVASATAAPVTDGKIGGLTSGDGLQLWADASQGVTASGGFVDSWADQSDSGVVFSSTGTARPAHNAGAINGRDALDFDGSNDFIEAAAANIFTNANATVFSVFEGRTSGTQAIFDTATNNLASRRSLYQNFIAAAPSVELARDPGPAVVAVSGAGTFNNGDVLVATGVYNGTNSSMTIHGSTGTNGASATGSIGASATPSDSPFVIGRRHALDFHFKDGLIAELVVFDTVLNTAQTLIVQNNLSSKYDRALTAGVERYAGDTPGNGDFDRDVFGIGRVDSSNIHSSGGMSGLGIEATGGSLDADDEWLLAGHTTPTNSIVAAEGLGDHVRRWSRSWYLDQTGSVDALLAFDYSDAGLAYADGQVGLLYRESLLDSWSILASPSLVLDDRFEFTLTSSQLNDGYYTVAVLPEPAVAMCVLAGAALFGNRRWKRPA